MKNKKEEKNKKGFTLAETMIVVSIIGVLSILMTVQLNTASQKGRDARRIKDASSLGDALILYGQENDYTFPVHQEWIEADIVVGEIGDRYIKGDIVDPINEDIYKYYYKSDEEGENFAVCTRFENQDLSYVVAPKGRGYLELYPWEACNCTCGYPWHMGCLAEDPPATYTPVLTPTPIPTPTPGGTGSGECGDPCTLDTDCINCNNICYQGFCQNGSERNLCDDENDCDTGYNCILGECSIYYPVSGAVGLNPNRDPRSSFYMIKFDGSVINRCHLRVSADIDSAGVFYDGPAIEIRIAPKGKNSQTVSANGEDFSLENAKSYIIRSRSGDTIDVVLYNDNPKNGKAMGDWHIDIDGDFVLIEEGS